MSAKGKCIYPYLRRPSQNEMSAKKKYFAINFAHLLQKACHSVPISVTVSMSTVSSFISLTLTHNIPSLFPAIPQHITISLILHIECTALLKTLHSIFWWDALPCFSDSHWLNNTFMFSGLSACLNQWRLTVFFTDGVSAVKNFKYMCSCFLCHVCGLINTNSWLFLGGVFNLWHGPDFICESCS